jgi:hypothetical protein
MEVLTVMVLSALSKRQSPPIDRHACERTALSARNTLLAALFFTLLTVAPAIWWRLRFGLWLTG